MDTKAAERRRKVNAVRVGSVIIGAPNPVVIQSMTTTPTLDTEASVAQTIAIAESGAQIVRLTAQGVNHAANLENISRELRSRGCDVPLVADIHFNPAAASEAAHQSRQLCRSRPHVPQNGVYRRRICVGTGENPR